MDIVISGLGIPPSVGSFDLDVSFDPSILDPIDVVFGLLLGDPSLFEADTGFTFSLGLVDFFEVSFLTPAELDALQTPSFTLATISFDTIGVGTSPLTFSEVIVGDAFGDPLDVSAGEGSVTVKPRTRASNDPSFCFRAGRNCGYRYRKRRMLNNTNSALR